MKKKNSNQGKSVSKVYPNLRKAIWLTHGKKCAYTGVDLNEDAFVVDHVIPKELGRPGRNDERLKVLRELGLPDDFDLYALTNMVPTTIDFNRRKSDRIHPQLAAKGLKVAAEKAEEVRKLCAQFDAVEQVEEKSRALVERYGDHLDERLMAETTYNVIRREPVRFEPIEDLGDEYAVIATQHIHSTCFAPVFPDYSGSLLLRFKRVEVYGCGITFGQRDLVGLFHAMGTPVSAGSRDFVVARDERQNEYLLQLGNNRFTLSVEEVADLCSVIDRLGAWYMAKLRRAEGEILNSIEFKRAQTGGYLMCGISLNLWRQILRFAASHDYAKGKTSWHVFDANPHYLKVFSRSNDESRYDYRAFIWPEMDTEIPLVGGPRVWLRWDSSLLHALHKQETSFKFGTFWDVARTHRWLTEQLIPEVVRWTHAEEMSELSFTGRALHRLLAGDERPPVPRIEKAEGADIIDDGQVRSLAEFELVVEKLWSRFSGVGHGVPVAVGDPPHRFLSFLLDNCDPISPYLMERTAHAFGSLPSVADLKIAVEQRRQDYLTNDVISGWELKSALEAVSLLLGEGNFKCSSERVLTVGLELLASLIEEYNMGVYIDRFTGRHLR